MMDQQKSMVWAQSQSICKLLHSRPSMHLHSGAGDCSAPSAKAQLGQALYLDIWRDDWHAASESIAIKAELSGKWHALDHRKVATEFVRSYVQDLPHKEKQSYPAQTSRLKF